MSATSTEARPAEMSEFRSPEQERAEQGADIRPVEEFTLEEINPFNAHLFSQHRWGEYFERLRREAPVHFNEIQTAGRYWSVTKYDDIKEVSPDCRDTDGYGDHT